MRKVTYKWVLRGRKMERVKIVTHIKDPAKPVITRVDKCKGLIDIRKSSELSQSETIIQNFLIKQCIDFQREYYCNKLFNPRTGKLLFFDFYLPDYKLMIEFDGQYHFKPINGDSNLVKQRKRDDVKNKFCKQMGLKILRIPYWQGNKIEEVICKWFDKHF